MTRLFRYGAGRKFKRELAGEGFDTVSVQFRYSFGTARYTANTISPGSRWRLESGRTTRERDERTSWPLPALTYQPVAGAAAPVSRRWRLRWLRVSAAWSGGKVSRGVWNRGYGSWRGVAWRLRRVKAASRDQRHCRNTSRIRYDTVK